MAKQLFPKGVRLELGATPPECRVIDVETGEVVDFVKRVSFELDANRREMTSIVLTLYCPSIEMFGSAVYDVEEDTLRAIADRHGYRLVKARA